MGAIAAKFRKEKTTYQLLENLEQEIKDIEQYSVSTQARQKRYVGNFLVISIGLYVIGFIVFYFAFFPPTWMERITYSIPLLIFPLLIFLLKRLVAWYFQRKLNKNSKKLNTLLAEKKKIIEKVMDKETYKVALEILNRFGGGQKPFEPKSPGSLVPRVPTPITPVSQTKPALTYRPAYQQKTSTSISQLSAAQHLTVNAALNRSISPRTPIRNNNNYDLSPAPSSGIVAQRNVNQSLQVQKKRTPYPIINQQDKGVLEKMVDYLIGDGPHNRFAMICKECFGHNGMALQEEYEYAAFRCAFCSAMNPSRKSRPVGPKLPMANDPTLAIAGGDDIKRRRESTSSSTSTSEKDSGSDSDDDGKKPSQVEKLKSENKSEEEVDVIDAADAIDPVDAIDPFDVIDTADAAISNEGNATEPTDKTNGEKKND